MYADQFQGQLMMRLPEEPSMQQTRQYLQRPRWKGWYLEHGKVGDENRYEDCCCDDEGSALYEG